MNTHPSKSGVSSAAGPISPADADRKLADLAKAGERAVGTTHDLQLTFAGVTDELVRAPGASRLARRLTFWNSGRQPVAGLKIFVPEPLAGQLRNAHTQQGGAAMNARLSVQVTEFDRATQDILCSVNQIQLYDEGWTTVRWSGSGVREAPPEPPPPSFTGPAFSGPPPFQPSPSPAPTASDNSTIVIVISSVEMVLIDGSTVRRRLDQMYIGSVESEPITKKVMMNSSNESAKASTVAPARIGQTCGRVTRRKTSHGEAPRSAADSSSAGSRRSSAALAISR